MKTPPISPVLRHVDLSCAHHELGELDRRYALVPAASQRAVHDAAKTVLATAADLGISNVAGLVREHINLLKVITKLSDPTRPQASDAAEPLHLHRNALLLLALAGCLYTGADTAPAARSVATLAKRGVDFHRPHTDDEIALLRMQALALSRSKSPRDRCSAAVYGLVDTGLVPGETTMVRTHDFADDPRTPLVEARGNAHLHSRVLEVEPLAAHVIRSLLEHPKAPTTGELLTYRPRAKTASTRKSGAALYAARAASAQGVIDRIRKAVGVNGPDLTASSITMWRLQTVFAEYGEQQMLAVSGRHSIEQLREVQWRRATSLQPRPNTQRRRSFRDEAA